MVKHSSIRKLHRWGGLFIAFFILFYSITGILLNHRKFFDYFIERKVERKTVEAPTLKEINSFLEHFKQLSGRADEPRVIRIKDKKNIELLYGSHGKITYAFHPEKGYMEVIEKLPVMPVSSLNRLHKAFKTGWFWVFFVDFLTIITICVTVTGLLMTAGSRENWLLIGTGLAGSVLAMVIAL